MKRVELIPVVLLLLFLPVEQPDAGGRGIVIEDFESGSVSLTGYPDQDHDPDDWSVQSSNVYEGNHALRIHGNSWKIEIVAPITLTEGTVWQSAVFLEDLGEMQGIGIGDGVNELFYTFGGGDLLTETDWWTVYQGAFPVGQWYAYLLPVGRDWFTTHGYLPVIDRLFYVNDDDSGSPGATVFDAIVDVTDDLPVAPTVNILYTINSFRKISRHRLH